MKIVIKNVSETATVVLHLACKWQVISSYLQKILGVAAVGFEPTFTREGVPVLQTVVSANSTTPPF